MTSIRRIAAVVLSSACFSVVPMAASEAPDAGLERTLNVRVAQDTTFTPVGSYSLDVVVGGQALTMSFTVAKNPDGTMGGVFKNAEMGEFPTTKFQVDGRKMTIEIVTPGGPASVILTVNKENVVEGEWSMQDDGSKITGKKTS